MRNAKIDANQTRIVDALRSAGCNVQSLATVGAGCPDLLVGTPDRLRIVLLEVKDGRKPPSARKLTPDQVRWHSTWAGWPVYVVTSADDAIRVCTAARIERTMAAGEVSA